jgi:hypothetical protein
MSHITPPPDRLGFARIHYALRKDPAKTVIPVSNRHATAALAKEK